MGSGPAESPASGSSGPIGLKESRTDVPDLSCASPTLWELERAVTDKGAGELGGPPVPCGSTCLLRLLKSKDVTQARAPSVRAVLGRELSQGSGCVVCPVGLLGWETEPVEVLRCVNILSLFPQQKLREALGQEYGPSSESYAVWAFPAPAPSPSKGAAALFFTPHKRTRSHYGVGDQDRTWPESGQPTLTTDLCDLAEWRKGSACRPDHPSEAAPPWGHTPLQQRPWQGAEGHTKLCWCISDSRSLAALFWVKVSHLQGFLTNGNSAWKTLQSPHTCPSTRRAELGTSGQRDDRGATPELADKAEPWGGAWPRTRVHSGGDCVPSGLHPRLLSWRD